MTGADSVSVTFAGDIAWVTIDNPPVNATAVGVRTGLMAAIGAVASARVAVLAAAGKTFVAGGDMTEFDAPPVPPHLPDVVQAIEDSPVPFIAALHGTVLGGGLELALGCAWRIAARRTLFGLPEVSVGTIPGAGGTQRLPRLIGVALAIEMTAAGKRLTAAEFQAAGALDKVVDGDLRGAVTAFAAELPPRPGKISARPSPRFATADWRAAEAAVAKKARGQNAPLRAVEALAWSALPFAEGQPKERALHLQLRQSEESRALRHVFFAERAVARPPAVRAGAPRSIGRVLVLGGGLMGAGIATAALSAGLSVTLLERDATAAKDAASRVIDTLEGGVRRGKTTADAVERQKAAFTATPERDAAAGHDLAIEAVFEDVALKRALFAQLSKVLSAEAILATNTSYLDPTAIFDGIPGPERCVGLHFFSPAHIMKLVEVVALPATSADTLATAFGFAKTLRKIAVRSGICEGFIGNRMLTAYRRAAEYMLADGALPEDVDAAMRAFGMAMGPFEVQDLSGLQIAEANRRRQDATRPAQERYVTIADQLCALGRLGQRSGKGWYRYDAGDRTPKPDHAVTALIQAYSDAAGIARKPISPQDIQIRLLAVLANEGARIVEEGIADSDAAIDLVKIHGYGFPRWRGGPMRAAEAAGDTAIRHALDMTEAASPG